MSDAALRHLRDALVLTNAAVAELATSDATQAALDHAVRARVHLSRSIAEQTDDPPIGGA